MKKICKILILVLFIFLINTNVYAKTPTLCDRDSLDNYGVNKGWNISGAKSYYVKNTPCVDASEKIYDFSGVLTDKEYEKLKKQIDKYVEKTDMDLVIVIENIPYSEDKKNEDYAADFYDYNDFGMFNDTNSGTLLLRNTYERDPYYNIYTFGVAQQYYDYNRLENILDDIYDNLHEERYYEGFSEYINLLTKYYDYGMALKGYKVDKNGYLHKGYVYPLGTVLIITVVITLIIMMILIHKNRMVKKATRASDYLDKTSVRITRREDIFLTTKTTSYKTSSGSSSGGGHSGGGHSSGGGRHG